MISNFLRPPQTVGEWTADAVRAAGVLSVLLALFAFEVTDAGVVALTLPAAMLPRFIAMRPVPDIVFACTVLVAGWSNVFDLYNRIPLWDLVVHFTCTGVLAAGLAILLSRLRIITDPRDDGFTKTGGVVLTTTLGLAISAVWEMIEWFGKAFVDDDIFVGYDDTIGDMAVGGLGALIAGLILAQVTLVRRPEDTKRS